MTDAELLVRCKKGLGIPVSSTAHDDVITQKVLTVKSFMLGAGVSETMMNDNLAVGVIVIGVGDLWNLASGEIKFSKAFDTMLTQLVFRS